jgi:hypothetical protein
MKGQKEGDRSKKRCGFPRSDYLTTAAGKKNQVIRCKQTNKETNKINYSTSL